MLSEIVRTMLSEISIVHISISAIPYLKLLIRHCDVKAISNPFPLICLCAKVTKIHTVLFATVN